jgi:competence protein ComEC
LHRPYSCLVLFLALAAGAIPAQPVSQANKKSGDLKIIVIDADGGAATLFLTPEGKSLLVDAGWPEGRRGPRPQPGAPPPPPTTSSADRIAAAASSLGIKKIDYLLMTHYHIDHAGGVDALLKKLPVDTFVDHGPNREITPPDAPARRQAIAPSLFYPKWVAAYQGHRHITVHTGETLKVGSLQLKFVAGDGKVLSRPLPGAGEANPFCANVTRKDDSVYEETGGEENIRSLGALITFGKTRILDLGDLTWNKEIDLLCPVNRVGKVDIYFVTGHGMKLSSSPPTAALDPLVALMQNGSRKGGDEAVIKTVDSYPHLEGFWRLHATMRYPQLDGDPNYIVNLNQEPDHAYPLELDVTPSGTITVTNSRNQFSRSYQSRAARASDKR